MSSGLVKGAGATVYAEGRPAVVPPMSVAKLVEPLPRPDATCADEPVRLVSQILEPPSLRRGPAGRYQTGYRGTPEIC
jgi:hypothetical protein